ncbi:MAG: aminotransferase class I/II-fold pyridoxal phosphate-dependent enzyme, partial [Acidimicrobiia bacterium]
MEVSSLPDLVAERTTDGLVEALGNLIKRGVISPGERLPTVRAVAGALGMGLATVSSAWGRLIEAGMIETRGRAGSFVPQVEHRTAARFFRYSRRGDFHLDLSTGLPDPDLLPSPARALAAAGELPHPSSYVADPVVPALEEQIRAVLPFPVPSVTVVDGALDALDRLLGLWVRLGDRVAVEDPGFPPIFDLVDAHRGQSVAVDTDREGMMPDSLARALATRPVVVVIQPRAQNPTGVSLSDVRARELAEVLEAQRDVWVIEDDHSGAISSRPLVSLAPLLPGRVVHITSFSKSHGPDFRLAGVGGPRVVLDRLVDRRRLGPAWSPRL